MLLDETLKVDGESQGFQPEDLLRQAQVQDVSLAPDGSTVVYSRRVITDNAYRTHLWLVSWTVGEVRQLTHGAANNTRPIFSPDGRSLVFISDRGGREQPWILPLDGGEPRLAAEIAGDAKVARWAPDSQRLLIIAHSGIERLAVGDPKDPTARVINDFAWRLDAIGLRNQLMSAWVAPIGEGEPRRITDPKWEVMDARWMPEGRHIVVVADAEPDAGMHRFSERAAAWRLAVDEPGDAVLWPNFLAALPRCGRLQTDCMSRSLARITRGSRPGRTTISMSAMVLRFSDSARTSIGL